NLSRLTQCAANKPTVNPWPSLIAGFCVTAVGIVLLTTERGPKEASLDNSYPTVPGSGRTSKIESAMIDRAFNTAATRQEAHGPRPRSLNRVVARSSSGRRAPYSGGKMQTDAGERGRLHLRKV